MKLNFIKVSIKGGVNKKGFTIIELIAATALATLLLCWEIPAVVKYFDKFNGNIAESREAFYVNQAFDYIESSVQDAKAAAVNNNIIELVRQDGAGSDWIRLDTSENLIISYYRCYYSNVNNIMKNTGGFSAVKSGKVILITITTKQGKAYRKCIYINMEKAEKDTYLYTL